MGKLKIIFYQTLMISTAILFGIGVQMVILHFAFGTEYLGWPWYIPLTIVLTGFLCSIPTLLILSTDNLSRKAALVRTVLHFILVGGIVTGCGFLFGWYTTWSEYAPILVMYVIIYIIVWVTTAWMGKEDEKRINEAIKDFRDEE